VPALDDRCSLRSEARDEPLAGTASTVRRWLLVECAGPWGRQGLLDGRLPAGVGNQLYDLGQRTGARVLLIRRVDRRPDVDGAVTCFAADTLGDEPWIGRRRIPRLEDAPSLDPTERDAYDPIHGPLAVVCTHGRRDPCCAERGRPLALATAAAFPEATWESTHVGGDRFAGNLVLFPHGLYFGHVEAVRGPEIVRSYVDGRIQLDRFRGRSSIAMYVQAAELHLRTTFGLDGIDSVRVGDHRREGENAVVRFTTHDGGHEVRVRRRFGDPMRLTCRSDQDEAPGGWEAV
jgi:hypothetical protein